jgi:hypothetical protein
MRPYRLLFTLAALYNLAFGVWAGLFPRSFFTLFQLREPVYPSLWSWVGVLAGVYALAYLHVARHPDDGDVIVAVGLLAKVLAPLGWLDSVSRGELPTRTYVLVLVNDLVWWFPFLAYLLRRAPAHRRHIAWVAVALHVLACVALMASISGTQFVEDGGERLRWIHRHVAGWVATWICWSLASMSLIAFTAAWASRLLEWEAPRRWVVVGFGLVALGLPFDLAGEGFNLVWPTQTGPLSTEAFLRGERLYALLSAGIANGLYCLGGLLLSVTAWRSGWLRGWVGGLGFLTWGVGLVLTGMVAVDNTRGMIATGAVVMALFIPWAALVGWRLGRADHPPVKEKAVFVKPE